MQLSQHLRQLWPLPECFLRAPKQSVIVNSHTTMIGRQINGLRGRTLVEIFGGHIGPCREALCLGDLVISHSVVLPHPKGET